MSPASPTGWTTDEAEEIMALASERKAISQLAAGGHHIPVSAHETTRASRVEDGIQFLSRWAGIGSFAGVLAGIADLAF
ncbi:hypothetical protein [Sphingobium mellinum]|uniref:hypothetical protein n=1 Tax=Sphingobium mellinum TaxID=1387166 RepID=UPI0030EF5D8B